MTVNRGTKGYIISRWVGFLSGLGFLGATAYGAWQFVQFEGTGANPFDMALAGLRLGVFGLIGGGAVGLVWGALVAIVRG